MSIEPGALYVVATPIGNLGDISARALEVLAGVALIAAEDTRHSGRLLAHFGIKTPLVSLHDHNERDRVPGLLAKLRAGGSIALVSDAGTPLISDPGFHLVRSARGQGLRVVPVPGPSSLLAALSAAGLPTDRFVFEGFLPARAGARRERLQALAGEPRTLVFFESGQRLAATLADMQDSFGADRPAVVARELTKAFEEIHGAALAQLGHWLARDPNRRKGEFVVLVHGAAADDADAGPQARRLLAALLEELPARRAAAVAAKITGLKTNDLYRLALALTKD
ncbi:MAG: 16S rRNA (cytidine(1402)-2'-O)-methyltransferase [Pseudomonadota bacterium]|nr:16S rRNA (cytidine(1402)-2'-O)-methyltransferase [Pseudomonadota bacterium]